MTSELKPCPFCWPEPSMVECHQDDYGYWKISCGRCGCHSGIRPNSDPDARSKVIGHWNTRAVPDVPELVRYDHQLVGTREDMSGMLEDADGEYVRYDQVAAMLAALKSKLYDMRQERDRALEWRDHDTERAESAEAELAQIKAREPVAWRCKPYSANAAAWEYQDAPFNGRDPEINEHQALYAAPVDQTAEIERLREVVKALGDASISDAEFNRMRNAVLSGKEPS